MKQPPMLAPQDRAEAWLEYKRSIVDKIRRASPGLVVGAAVAGLALLAVSWPVALAGALTGGFLGAKYLKDLSFLVQRPAHKPAPNTPAPVAAPATIPSVDSPQAVRARNIEALAASNVAPQGVVPAQTPGRVSGANVISSSPTR